jgi:hypothetical protein
MEVELVGEAAPAWAAFLGAVPHDVYHLPGYAAMSAAQEPALDGAEARAIIVRDGDGAMLLPIIVRSIPGDENARDAISPYGYPGPLFRGRRDEDWVARACTAMVDRLRDERIVSLFVRTHPLLNREMPGLDVVGTVLDHGETVSIDLTATAEELWRGTRSSHRNEINRAIRAGHRAYIDEGWDHEAAFVEMYTATMKRVGAGATYMFAADYVRALRATLGPRLHLCVVDVGGAIAAAGMFTEECGIVQYHLSGTDERFARERPTKLMLHFVRGFMKERNNRVMHLGGGLHGAHDSLFDFKAGFSKGRQPFRTWRVVVDPDLYSALSRARHPAADPADPEGFFPLYRRSVA